MKAIIEYHISGKTTGKITAYPKNIKRCNYKSVVTEELKGYHN